MAYIECKVWHFQRDDDIDLKSRHEAMKAGCRFYIVKALIDTSSRVNSIRKAWSINSKWSTQNIKKKTGWNVWIYLSDMRGKID